MDVGFYKQQHQLEKSHWWFIGRRRILGEAMDRLSISGSRILDVGCGTGANLSVLKEKFPTFVFHGVDFELEPLRFCRAEHSDALSQADVTDLPFKSSTFDLIVGLDTLEHVRDDARALKELLRISRPGGSILLTVPAFPFLWGNIDDIGHHFRRYRRRELVQKIESTGFRITEVRYFNFILFPPIAILRLLAKLFPKRVSSQTDHIASDFDIVQKGVVNSLLTAVFSMEASMFGMKPPFGVSILCTASRPEPGK